MIPSEIRTISQTESAMNKKYIVRLTDAEREQLTELTRKGKAQPLTDIEQVLREKKPFILRCMLDGIKKLQGRMVNGIGAR